MAKSTLKTRELNPIFVFKINPLVSYFTSFRTAQQWTAVFLLFMLHISVYLHGQVVLEQERINLGSLDPKTTSVLISIYNKSSNDIHFSECTSTKGIQPKVLDSRILPGHVGRVRLHLLPTGSKKVDEKVHFVFQDRSSISLQVIGKKQNKVRGKSQDCPDFSKQSKRRKRSNSTKLPLKKSSNKDVLVSVIDEPSGSKSWTPVNLVFLVDASSSMSDYSKRMLFRYACHALADELRPSDQLTIISYAGEAKMEMPTRNMVSGNQLLKIIDEIEPAGFTNGSTGISSAYRVADSLYDPRGRNVILLATDGAFNANETDNISSDILSKYEGKNIQLCILGIQNEKWAVPEMKSLTEQGNGKYINVRTRGAARKSIRKTFRMH